MCGCAGIGRQASLRCLCPQGVRVRVPLAAPTEKLECVLCIPVFICNKWPKGTRTREGAAAVRQHGVLSNRLRAKATVRGAEGGRRCMQRWSSPVGRVPLPHPFTFVSSPPASYSSPDFCHLTPFRSKPPDFFCCIWLYMKKAGANPLRSFRFLVLHSHRLHPIRHQPGGQVSFLFPSMWKCRCFTVWKASSPLLLTTR